MRTLAAHVAGKEPGPEASVRKALADDLGQEVTNLAVDLAGAQAMLANGSAWGYAFLFAQALTIGGGTAQVQRNIIGERVLGLPHDPGDGQTRAEAGEHPVRRQRLSGVARIARS